MRIVFPTNDNQGYLSARGAHFGKAKYYTIVNCEETVVTQVEVIENPGHKAGGCGHAIQNIMNLKPDALIVSGIGASPAKGFANAGLQVYFDKHSQTVKDSVESFFQEHLKAIGGEGTCSTH
jgi:predicted Fe-Mo cluster-binding NifX family protein